MVGKNRLPGYFAAFSSASRRALGASVRAACSFARVRRQPAVPIAHPRDSRSNSCCSCIFGSQARSARYARYRSQPAAVSSTANWANTVSATSHGARGPLTKRMRLLNTQFSRHASRSSKRWHRRQTREPPNHGMCTDSASSLWFCARRVARFALTPLAIRLAVLVGEVASHTSCPEYDESSLSLKIISPLSACWRTSCRSVAL